MENQTSAIVPEVEITDLVIDAAKTPEQMNAVQEYKSLEEVVNLLTLIEQGKKIKITNVDQIELIAEAKEVKRNLQKARTAIDNKRKELKAEINLQGKAIDGMANVFTAMIVPVEKELEEAAKFVEREQEKQLKDVEDSRIAELSKFVADVSFYDLRAMSEEGFKQLLKSSEIAFKTQKEAEEKAAEEQRKAELEAQQEKERLEEENERLKAEQEESERIAAEEKKKNDDALEAERLANAAKVNTERIAREKAEAEAKALKDAQDRRDREAKEKADAEEKAKRAPDKTKLQTLAVAIAAIELPKVKSEAAKQTVIDTTELLNKTSNFIKGRIAKM